MPNPLYIFHATLLTLLLTLQVVQAEELRQTELLQKIDAFKQTELYPFAVQTIKRANAYLGAAMLASEQKDLATANNAFDQANAKLAEAKQTAVSFTIRFASLITLKKDAITSVEIISTSGQSVSNFAPADMIKSGNKFLKQAISNHESGQLNLAQSDALKAQKSFQDALDEILPRLTELSASAVGKAANGGAKQYAPQIYQAAKDSLAELRNYTDGLSSVIPSPPVQALYLAREARYMADQVKQWRKKSRSHEELILQQRSFNLQLANVLGISAASNAMLVDIPASDVLAAVQNLNKTLDHERQMHQQAILQLKQQSSTDLQHQLAAQTESMTQAQQSRMATIKEAFRAKLERETFDKKRQQKLRLLFKDHNVQILVNLDGSLLLRLSELQFSPAKSKIDAKYFPMLSQLNETMTIYHDRKLSIEGHTDNLGDIKPNQALSLKRAESVRDFLIASGADGSRLKALGYGEVRPIASNDFPKGRTMNRRIDVVIKAVK